MLKNGINISYIYQTTQKTLFQTITLTTEDTFVDEGGEYSDEVLQIIDNFQSRLPFDDQKSGVYIGECIFADGVISIKGAIRKEIPAEELEGFGDYLKSMLIGAFKTSSDHKNIFMEGISIHFLFTDNNGEELINIFLTPDDFPAE